MKRCAYWMVFGGFATLLSIGAGCGDDSAAGGSGGDDTSSDGGAGGSDPTGGSASGGEAEGGMSQGGMSEGGMGEGGSGGGSTGPTLDEACADYSAAWCAERDACSNGHFISVNYGDLATCEARQAEQCMLRGEAVGTSFTADRIAECAEALDGFACEDLTNALLPDACIPSAGALALGEACSFGSQCESAYCESSLSEACGVCAAAPEEGASCADDTGCGAGAGLKCDDVTLTCIIPGDESDPCDGPVQCKAGLSCVGASDLGPGTCEVAGMNVGDTCDGQAVTAPDCERPLGLRCAQGECVHVTYAEDGESCGISTGAVAVCEANGQCVGPQGDKSCVAAVADGEACDTVDGPACESPANCLTDGVSTSGVCGLLDASVCAD